MSLGNIIFLTVVVSAFAVFMAGMAWGEFQTRERK